MAELINITAYYVISGILYLCLAVFIAVNFSRLGGELYERSKEKIKGIIIKLPPVRSLIINLDRFVWQPARLASRFSAALLLKIGIVFLRFDIFVSRYDSTLPGESVNYSALLLRKLYNEKVQLMLSYSIIGIVVFYFILTVL
jgi:hypothetical protein